MDSALPLSPDLEQRLDHLGLEFLADFYEISLERHPGELDVVTELANIYTRLGRVEDGLRLDRELVQRLPTSSTAHYNLACSLALAGQRDEACTELERALELGYRDLAHLLQDEDLASLRGVEKFERIVDRLRTLSPD